MARTGGDTGTADPLARDTGAVTVTVPASASSNDGTVRMTRVTEGTYTMDTAGEIAGFDGRSTLTMTVADPRRGYFEPGYHLCQMVWEAGGEGRPHLPCPECTYTFDVAHEHLPEWWNERDYCWDLAPNRHFFVKRDLLDEGLGVRLEQGQIQLYVYWYHTTSPVEWLDAPDVDVQMDTAERTFEMTVDYGYRSYAY